MPIYAYRCGACGAEEEHIQRFSDPPMKKCQSCGGKLARVVTAAAFHLKGGGWYKDGYATARPEGGKADEGGSAAADGGGEGAGAAAKPAAGTDPPKKKAKKKAKGKAAAGGGG